MDEILLSRYDIFKEKHRKTHITTNLNAQELKTRYRSRLREIFNLIGFDELAKDKRQ